MNFPFRNLMIAFIASVCVSVSVMAQNTFPSTGRVGIYTTSPAASLQIKGGARIGTATSYVNIDSATGNLSYVGTSGYLVGKNKYVFRYSGNPNLGLFFNSTLFQYEFRNGSAVPVFAVNANTGNSVFNGTLKIGAYTLPATDGSSGQVLTTNGSGTVNWSTVSGGSTYTAGTGISISGTTITNTAPDKTVTLTGSGATTISGTYPNFTISSTDNNTTYTAGSGLSLTGTTFSNTAPDKTVTLTGSGATTVSGTYPNFTISSTDNNTTYTAGTGISISGTTISSTLTGSQWTTSGSNIYYNNGSVGIGTSTPQAILDVNGDASINGLTVGTGGGNSVGNSAIGYQALNANIAGSFNTATGFSTLFANTTGSYNTANGFEALQNNSTGFANTASGYNALFSNTGGFQNTANGWQALYANTTGDYNTATGEGTLSSNTTGNSNTGLGFTADVATGALTNASVLGYNAIVDASNKVRVGNTSVTSIGGQVGWTNFSDGRYKKNIKEDVKGLTFINALRPVTYTLDLKTLNDHYDAIMKNRPDSLKQKLRAEMKESETAGSKIIYNGFIAQEVESAANKLNYSFSGVDKPATKDGVYGLRYSDFVVPLVKAVQELSKQNDSLATANATQQNINAGLQKQIDELKAVLLSGNQSSSIAASQINKQTIELSGAATLSQNIPNPFSNSTTINYYLPVNNGKAFINFYDVNGTVLKSVTLSGNGNGSLILQASELPSGVYRYALFVEGKSIDSKQMERLK